MGYKIAVSKSGIDAGTATVAQDFNYNSDYNTLKYYSAGSLQLIGTAVFPLTSRKYGTITHNLGYSPFTVIFANPGGNPTRFYPFGVITGNQVTETTSMSIGTDIIRIMYKIVNGDIGIFVGTVTVWYKIFRNNLGI